MGVVAVACLLLPVVAHAVVLWASGRRLLARDRWRLWIPIAGSIAVATAWSAPVQRRAAVLVAGIAAAYLAVAIAAFAFLLTLGERTEHGAYRVARLTAGSPAEGALEPGDRLLEVDGEPIGEGVGAPLAHRIDRGGGRPVVLAVERRGRQVTATVTPRYDQAARTHRIGVELEIDEVRARPYAVDAALSALQFPALHSRSALRSMLDDLFIERPAEGVIVGPVGIRARLSQPHPFESGLGMAILESVVLALCNLVLMVLTGIVALRRGGAAASG